MDAQADTTPKDTTNRIIAISSDCSNEGLEALQFAVKELNAKDRFGWNAEEASVEEETVVDESMVQITASKEEMDRRIESFIQRKRAEINNSNVLEFCNRHISETSDFSCARTQAVVHRRKDGTSHLRQTQAFNVEGPQTSASAVDKLIAPPLKKIKTEIGEEEDESRMHLPLGVRERLLDLEDKVSTPMLSASGPVPKDIYARIKAVEDRVTFLEGVSPEYFASSKRIKTDDSSNPPAAAAPSESEESVASSDSRRSDLAKSLSGINSRIQELQASLMVKRESVEK